MFFHFFFIKLGYWESATLSDSQMPKANVSFHEALFLFHAC